MTTQSVYATASRGLQDFLSFGALEKKVGLMVVEKRLDVPGGKIASAKINCFISHGVESHKSRYQIDLCEKTFKSV